MIGKSLIPEFDHECATTRKLLERIPEDKLAWGPHEKSFTLGGLAGHLANVLEWAPPTMNLELMDIEPEGIPWKQPSGVTSIADLLDRFDRNCAAARAALASAGDEAYLGNWSLAKNGRVVMSMPRIAVIRSFILNHTVHHRGQLSVYLRLLNVPVPSI